ncbi:MULTISPECIES: GNAT family N-acetyltransferase [Paraburkholderia]|uniref:GNAT family N-acetyltransferase n=1 Tax=Paraburkholderia youngii TaxID=2782701 RepID=A0A7W8LGZ9_9BURK|nr:GNAT family N-acetyltransferase [Paraburkholderia youngii]MBB5405626.1 RimJ/RimL family protein N-acetyltransferase [Paraburkholderia youngii]NUX53777.1 GNAT family N-acetyltransferase [Paraburkholderia youngii]NVI06555.1 GNAT family N-acetyltransferase [Paraburkholderia youngii]
MLQRPTEIQIESTRLLIKPFTASDADAAFACITPSLTRHMAWDTPASRQDFDEVWQSWIPSIDDGSDYVFAIRHRADGSFLGLAGLHRVRMESPELGIWIREDRHRNGFGREAVTAVAQWATRTIGCASFTYPVAEENRSSRHIAESLGGVIVESRVTPKYTSCVYRIPRLPVTNQV